MGFGGLLRAGLKAADRGLGDGGAWRCVRQGDRGLAGETEPESFRKLEDCRDAMRGLTAAIWNSLGPLLGKAVSYEIERIRTSTKKRKICR